MCAVCMMQHHNHVESAVSSSPSLHFQVPLGTTPVRVLPLGGRLLPLAAYSAGRSWCTVGCESIYREHMPVRQSGRQVLQGPLATLGRNYKCEPEFKPGSGAAARAPPSRAAQMQAAAQQQGTWHAAFKHVEEALANGGIYHL